MTPRLFATGAVLMMTASASAQDIRGIEVCTAEKTMERRTSCLQSNVEFLQQALAKQARDTQAKLNAAAQDSGAQKAEIATLKAELAKLQNDLADLKRDKAGQK